LYGLEVDPVVKVIERLTSARPAARRAQAIDSTLTGLADPRSGDARDR